MATVLSQTQVTPGWVSSSITSPWDHPLRSIPKDTNVPWGAALDLSEADRVVSQVVLIAQVKQHHQSGQLLIRQPHNLKCSQEAQGPAGEPHRGTKRSQVGLGAVGLPGEEHVSEKIPANDAVQCRVGAKVSTQCGQRQQLQCSHSKAHLRGEASKILVYLGFRNLGCICGGISLQRWQAAEGLVPGVLHLGLLHPMPICPHITQQAGKCKPLLLLATEPQYAACNMPSNSLQLGSLPRVVPLSTTNVLFSRRSIFFFLQQIAKSFSPKQKINLMVKIHSGF